MWVGTVEPSDVMQRRKVLGSIMRSEHAADSCAAARCSRGEAPFSVRSSRRDDLTMTAPARLSLVERAKRAVRRIVLSTDEPAATDLLPVTPFATWGYDDAVEALDDATAVNELAGTSVVADKIGVAIPGQAVYRDPRATLNQLDINRAFFEGDHWQMGAGWIGPHPSIGDKDFDVAMLELVTAFTSKNVIREVTKRHASGVVGKEPSWSFVPRRTLKEGEQPTADEQTAIDTANALMREWYDARKVRSLMHDAVCTLLFASRAPLRLYIPAGRLRERVNANGSKERVVVVGSIQQALGLIWPDHPKPEDAAVVTDDDTKMEAGVRKYAALDDDGDTDGDAGDTAERDLVEIVFLDRRGGTCIRVVSEDDEAPNGPAADAGSEDATGEAQSSESYTFDYGARLTMIEMRRDPLVTPQVCQQQRALNLAISMLPRNVITGGFLERVLLNAQMPGRYQQDPDGATKRFIPDALQFGAGTTNFFAGLEVKDAQGSKTLSTPSVHYREPVAVDSPVKAAGEHYLAILDETSQLHVVLSGDAVVSGKSRQQAHAEFESSLGDTKPEAESALRFLLETPLAMAEALCGKTGELTSLVRVEVQCRLDTGPLDTAERTALESSIGKTISRETAMSRVNVDDADAELARMAADPLSRAVLVKAQADALTAATSAGMTVETAAAWIDIDPDILSKIKKDAEASGFFDNSPLANNPAKKGDGTAPTDGSAPPKNGKAGRTPPAGQNNAPGRSQATGGSASSAGGQ